MKVDEISSDHKQAGLTMEFHILEIDEEWIQTRKQNTSNYLSVKLYSNLKLIPF